MEKPKKKRGRPRKKPEGLGDVVEQVTEATGIKKAVEWIAGKDCGCDERKEKLNKMFPFAKLDCLTEKEYKYLKEYLPRHNENRFEAKDVFELVNMHHRIFKVRPKVCMNCNSGIKTMRTVVEKLTKLYEQY